MNKLLLQLKTMTIRQKDLEEKYMNDARMKVQLNSKTNEIKVKYVSFCKTNLQEFKITYHGK